MAQGSSFTVLYVAGMGALELVAVAVALRLTGERHPGFVGNIETPVLLAGAILFVAAGVGGARSPGEHWPLLVAAAALILVIVLAFLTFTLPESGSALIFELAAVVAGALLVSTIRKG